MALFSKTAAPKPEAASHIIVGFSWPDSKNPNETISASTRHGIWLAISSQIYTHLLKERPEVSEKEASHLADNAFTLTNVYLRKLDEEVAKLRPTLSTEKVQ